MPYVDVRGPPGWNADETERCWVAWPDGIAPNRAVCYRLVLPIDGLYEVRSEVGGRPAFTWFSGDTGETMGTPEITDVAQDDGTVEITWTNPGEVVSGSFSGSCVVRVNPVPFTGM